MADSADIGILITDTALVVRSWDPWLQLATGIPPETACGRPLGELVPRFEERGLLTRFNETLATGVVHVLSPALHHYLIPCPPRGRSPYFTQMQQRVHVGPLMDGGRVEGVIVTIADVTAQLDTERMLASQLESRDPETRRRAADEMARSGRIESFEHFTPALGADDWKVRRTAVGTLARAADREVLNSLLDALRRDHRSFNSLSSALKLLALTDVSMTAPLVQLLQEEDADLRIQAALALGEHHDLAAVEPLVRALGDPDPNVRFHVIEALGRLRASEAVDPLAGVVEGGDFFLAFAAIDALALINDRRVAPRLAPLLANDELRDAVAAALGVLGDDEAVVPLVETLNASAAATPAVAAALTAIEQRDLMEIGDRSHVAEAVRAHLTPDGERHLLGAMDTAGPDVLPALARVIGWIPGAASAAALVRLLALPHVREAAIEALLGRGDAVVDLLVERTTVEENGVRLAAITALGRVGSHRATAALLPLLGEAPDIAIAAAGALARIGDPAAFEGLLRHAGHPHAAVRQSIVGALNSIGHPEMESRVRALLDHPDAFVRESAVRMEGYFGYEGTTDLLMARTQDPDELVRIAALEHLPFVDDARVFDGLCRGLQDGAPRVRAAAARALARLDHPGVHRPLMDALRDPNLWVRYYAARGLAKTGDTTAAAALTAGAASDTAPHVRIAAIDALGVIGDQGAAQTLLACAEDADEEIAAAALRSLGAVGGPHALARLQQGMRSESIKLRLSAVRGLAAHAGAEAVSALAWAAGADPDKAVAEAAIAALAEVGSAERPGAREAADTLLELQADPRRADAASAALTALGPRKLEEIARGLHHPQADVRRRTVESLARLRTADATRLVGQSLDDGSAVVRETAILALNRLGARGFEARLQDLAQHDASKAVRRAAADAAARLRRPI